MTAAQRRELFRRLREANPHPAPELDFETPFQLLVAVILSAQATDASVNKATATLFAEAPDPQTMLSLGEEGIKRHIRSIGLFNTKAANLLRSCRLLIERHDGKVPDSRNALEALPGVGRKTANVVLNIAFGKPTIAVDTHVFRVSNRTGLAPGPTPAAVEKRLLEVVPKEFLHDAHHWLILHGRYICTARRPQCPRCPIADLCEFPDKTPADASSSAPTV